MVLASCPECGHKKHSEVEKGSIRENKIDWYDITCSKCKYQWVVTKKGV